MKKSNTFSKNKYAQWATAYLFLLPAFLLWLVWFCIPVFRSFGLSFFKYNYVMSNDNHFVGLQNYISIFSDGEFLNAFIHSLIIVVFSVPIQTALSLVMALLINMKFRGRGIFRTIFYSPYVISPIAVATVFMYLFTQDQPLVRFFALFGMENISWAVSVRYALPLVIIMYIWQQCGFYMIMFLSGLQTISEQVLEASAIDGANKLQTFWYVTFPMLRPTTFLVVTYGVITSFQIFDQISAIAGTGVLGTPGNALSTLVTYFYLNSFKYGEIGYGSAAAVILFVLIFLATLIQKKFLDKDV